MRVKPELCTRGAILTGEMCFIETPKLNWNTKHI
jgi:hypothetical protein